MYKEDIVYCIKDFIEKLDEKYNPKRKKEALELEKLKMEYLINLQNEMIEYYFKQLDEKHERNVELFNKYNSK